MRKVEIRVRQADLPHEMGAMRDWLDRSGYVTIRFDCKRDAEAVLICIEFAVGAEGDAFAARFNSQTPLI
jgi:hypothetical protein